MSRYSKSRVDREVSDPVHIPIDGTLDLHTFNPGELKQLIPDYLHECRNNTIYQVRIIHGKGTGTLRRSVHSILQQQSMVSNYSLGV
ncbi:MAG: DNA mismatch repair protein MutS [Desulfobulbus propionicus]|nr:MAG: DNA mismatch repair protein MutS [Desulfobulbus propionicus]